MQNNEQELKGRIRMARGDLTQEKLAEMIKVHKSRISEWESGKITPSLPTLQKIAQATGVSLPWLLTGEKGGEDAGNSHKTNGNKLGQEQIWFLPVPTYMEGDGIRVLQWILEQGDPDSDGDDAEILQIKRSFIKALGSAKRRMLKDGVLKAVDSPNRT